MSGHLAAILLLLCPVCVLAQEIKPYPDEEGMKRRSAAVIAALASQDLNQWRRGYFAGGDPGKCLPGAAMAKLLHNPNDPEPARYLNDDRSYREQYHFAAVNWARLYPLFGQQLLTPETREKLRREASNYDSYLNITGTENHRTMWMTSANVLPWVLDTGLSKKSKQETLRQAKEMLRAYVKGLYAAGQGEWDSSTYLMFDINGLLNIHDFSEDPECRLMAQAGLDWLVAAYALKYRDGVYCGPNQRGYAASPFTSIADHTGYVWFGDTDHPPADLAGSLYTLHAITSKWRPSKAIYDLATKQLPTLPVESRNTKPNYWYGQEATPRLGEYAESLYVGRHFSMGSLWNGYGGQITRFQIVASTPDGAVTFTGGHPRKSDHTGKKLDEFGYRDGIGRYDQSAQVGSAYVCLTVLPDDEPIDYVFLSLPEHAQPQAVSGWQVLRAGDAWLAVRGIGAEAKLGLSDLTGKQLEDNQKATAAGKAPKHRPIPILKISGRQVGLIVETADVEEFPEEKLFLAALAKSTVEGDANQLRYQSVGGHSIQMKYVANSDRAQTLVDGKQVDSENWKLIYDCPYLRAAPGMISINDGVNGYSIDFTGDLPVYRIQQPAR